MYNTGESAIYGLRLYASANRSRKNSNSSTIFVAVLAVTFPLAALSIVELTMYYVDTLLGYWADAAQTLPHTLPRRADKVRSGRTLPLRTTSRILLFLVVAFVSHLPR
ncbi:hypothetical protein GGX14DRAFT_567064 [Mycena pura]|uniref:Uncharacterized protein n=1 Tax=Mycena pura TaxID=153505 RepID=A0AAD6VBN0_9AGAR|nr:hypothetical protein GGX14DRAFT_567064 [Mycena pura]